MALPQVPGGLASPGLIVAGGLVIGLATVLGAWLARQHAIRRETFLGAAAGALLVIAGAHLLPDAWAGARQAALPWWVVPAATVAAFAVAGALIRRGCACQADREAAGGAGAAAALAGHRLLEGAALALAGSILVTVALAVHAVAEGLAAGTLLAPGSRRRRWLCLAAMCASPMAGAALAGTLPLPRTAQPVLLAIAAGVLGQVAWISLAAAGHRARPVRLAAWSPAAATLLTAAVTALAVHGAG